MITIRKFIWILGPHAVGKMTIGNLLSEKIGYNFLHNHISIELGLQHFPYGTPGFKIIDNAVRESIFKANAKHSEKGFIFSFTMAFNLQSEYDYVKKVMSFFEEEGDWEFYFIELEASLKTRLQRNIQPDRIEAKPSKSDTERSNHELKETMKNYQLNSEGDFKLNYPHIVINNENLSPEDTVNKITSFCELI